MLCYAKIAGKKNPAVIVCRIFLFQLILDHSVYGSFVFSFEIYFLFGEFRL